MKNNYMNNDDDQEEDQDSIVYDQNQNRVSKNRVISRKLKQEAIREDSEEATMDYGDEDEESEDLK